MKHGLIITACILIITMIGHAGDKPELKWKSVTDGFAEAKKTKKKIMLDVYTDWCGWCKRLDKDVYANEKISEYLNKEYVVIKLNAESTNKVTFKGEELTEMGLAQGFGVRSYPTIIFFDSESEPITSLGGYLPPERFLPVIKFIGGDLYKTMKWEDYQKKNTDSKVVD